MKAKLFGSIQILVFACLISLAMSQLLLAAEWTPSKPIELVVGSSPGSGTDSTARILQRILTEKKLVPVPVSVINKPGGGDAIAFSYVDQHPGSPDFVVSSYNLITNHILGRSSLGLTNFVPLALLFNEYVSFIVRSDSPIKSIKGLVERLKQHSDVVFATSAAIGSANHIALASAMKAAGVNPSKLKIVIFKGGGEATAALLGGHVDVVVTSISGAAKFAKVGTVRILANSSPQRLDGLADIPTLTEQGIPVVVSKWRVLFACKKGLTETQIAYWNGVFGALIKTAEWHHYLKESYSSNESKYLNSKETLRYLKEQRTQIKAILSDLGLTKSVVGSAKPKIE